MVREIGSGGEGSVYLMLHTSTGQLRAVKRICRRNGVDGIKDVKALRFLRHNGLPQMIEVRSDENYYWIVMSYVRGKSLQQIINVRHRVSAAKTVDAGKQLCRILMYLHSRREKVLHLDLKPANIIVGSGGHLVLLDFGSAHRTKGRRVCPAAKDRSGTDGFAPPELYQPEAVLDEKSDIYEMGAVLFYLVSGTVYSPACIKSHIPGCPEELERVIHRCLQPEPADRYQTARDVLADLDRLEGRSARRRRRETGWFAVLMAVLCAGIAMPAVGGAFSREREVAWNCDRILQEAACVGGEEKTELYMHAAAADPENEKIYEQLIDEAAADGSMDRREWERITRIFRTRTPGQERTNEQFLSENVMAYGKECLRIGMLCRYSSENEIREAASGWFEKAAEAYGQCEEGVYAGLFCELERKEKSAHSDKRSEWQIRKTLVGEGMRTLTGKILSGRMADRALDSLLLTAGELLQEGVDAEEIRESAEIFAQYDGETDGKNRQRLELIDHMLGISRRKEKAAWEKVTE